MRISNSTLCTNFKVQINRTVHGLPILTLPNKNLNNHFNQQMCRYYMIIKPFQVVSFVYCAAFLFTIQNYFLVLKAFHSNKLVFHWHCVHSFLAQFFSKNWKLKRIPKLYFLLNQTTDYKHPERGFFKNNNWAETFWGIWGIFG